ncbi:MAG: flagellar basal-body rod protein FlgF [Smithella sp.]
MSSFYTAISGLTAFTEQLSVISNNISNSETTGYKSESVTFAEVLSGTTSSSASTGNGTSVLAASTLWTQGSLTSTGNSTDLALTGKGYFVVDDSSGATYYTRNGEFEWDSDQSLVTTGGYYVQGYEINDDGSYGAVTNIDLSADQSISATATSTITSSLNLNSAADSSSTFSVTVTTYDSLGDEIPVSINFTKSATDNTWTWQASIDPSDGSVTSGSGTLTFNSDGTLESGTDPSITLGLTNGATTPQTITWDIYGTTGATNGSITQNASSSVLTSSSNDGMASGTLQSVSISSTGVITGTYSNGETKDLYQIELADFSNYDGLKEAGSSLYKETSESGAAVYGVAGSAQFGSLTAGSLETSNVDMATQLTEMIVAQRAYEACAKVITTQSEMLQTTIKMA